MEQPSRPTAAELGISDVEYERILNDMRRRGLHDAPYGGSSVGPTGGPGSTSPAARRAPSTDEPAPPRRRRRLAWALLGALLVVTVVTRVGATHRGPAYQFLETVGDRPVTYSSCGTIQVAVYPAGGPPDAEALVREAVAEMRSVTGLNIVVTGVYGGHAPNWNFKAAASRPDDPISVSWQDGDALAELTDDIAGLGGSAVFSGRNGSERLGAGTIALSRDYYAKLARRGDHAEALAVLLHEFGHVFGLGHVHSSDELMYDHNVGRKTFGAGDLDGLRRLGQGPCT
jgi:hypothetical protein